MAEDQEWMALLDHIQDALTHALNGRVAGFDGIMQLARLRGRLDGELMGLMEDEVKRLAEIATASARLPRRGRDAGALTTLADAIAAAVAVNGIRRGVALTVRPAAEPAVVRAAPDDVVRCLLLLIRALERPAGGADEGSSAARMVGSVPSVIEIAESTDGGTACVRLGAEAGGSAAAAVIEEARALLLPAGGVIEVVADGSAVELRLPALRLD